MPRQPAIRSFLPFGLLTIEERPISPEKRVQKSCKHISPSTIATYESSTLDKSMVVYAVNVANKYSVLIANTTSDAIE